MNASAPASGFLQAYRLFVIIRILFWLAVGPVLILLDLAGSLSMGPGQVDGRVLIRRMTLPEVAPFIVVELFLLALLLWPRAQERLGSKFVPVTLGLGLAPLLAGYYLWPAANPLQSPFAMFFLVTAVLVAWEYKFVYEVLYVAALSIYQALVSSWPPGVPWTATISWLVLQAVMMLLVAYVVYTLISVQREQRAALAQAYRQQAVANRRLQQYAATLEELAISRERNRLARELHDTLAHSLSALAVQLEAGRSLWDTQPEKARRILEQAGDTIRTGMAEARRALQALRASPLEDLGLVLAVRELAETAAERAGAELTLRLPAEPGGRMSLAVEQGFYRIAQEALENVVRHACARSILVSIEETAAQIKLAVEDDGVGIDVEATPAVDEEPARGSGQSLGIRGMQERARLIGGELTISRLGVGTRVELVVPFESQVDGTRPDL